MKISHVLQIIFSGNIITKRLIAGIRGAKDARIAQYARENHLCLLTGDIDFADVRKYPPEKYAGIIVLRLPGHATASFILRVIEQLLQQEALLAKIPGKLAIVEPGQVRLRS